MGSSDSFSISSLSVCPVTGLSIRHEPHWCISIEGPKPYQAKLSLIGDRILHAEILGFTTLDISKRYLDLVESICADEVAPEAKIIFIEDYSSHTGASGESRNYYIRRQRNNRRLAGIIFYNTSYLFTAVIRVGRMFARPGYAVEIAADYAAAVSCAVNVLERGECRIDTKKESQDFPEKSWRFEFKKMSVDFKLMPGDILFSSTQGSLETAEDVEAFELSYRQLLSEWNPPKEGFYRLMDWTGLKHISWKARGLYMQSMTGLQKEYYCRMAVLYGLSPFARAVYMTGRHFLPIPIIVTSTKEEALAILNKHTRSMPAVNGSSSTQQLSYDKIEAQVYNLIDLMASINWEQSGLHLNETELKDAGPLRPLYDALYVLKQDFDEIMQKKKDAENMRSDIEEQLHHAEKMQTLGTLAGGVAHDFNNMLGGITGFASLIKTKYGPLDPGILRYSDMILETGKRAGTLIQGLLTFAHKGRQETVEIDIHEMISNLTLFLNHTISKAVRLQIKLDAENATILGDRSQIQNSLLNLAVNAADAMPDGGVLTFTTRIVHLDDTSALIYPVTAGEYLEISVSDTGTGIPPEIRKKIFEPFFTTKSTGKGTGLGLSSVYGTLQNHAGGIALESEMNRGTAFRLYFKTPIMRIQTPVSAARLTPEKSAKGKILLVDDELALRSAVEEMLQELGYSVVSCADGVEAVETFSKVPKDFDAVVLDMIMPRMGGAECFERLRAIRPDIPILLSTGFADRTQVETLLERGATGFIAKPYHMEQLAEALQTTVTH